MRVSRSVFDPERRVGTAMSKLVESIAPLCFIHDVDFKNLMEDDELVVGEDLTENVDFAPADPPYNIQRNENNAHAAYDLFGLNDAKDIAKVLGDFMKPGAHGHSFCSALQFILWYKAHAL